MDLNKNYYNILGIDKNSDEKTIKKKFRELSKKFHPDKEGGSEAKFQSINEANTILSDSKTRSQYDHNSQFGNSYNPRRSDPFGFGGFDINDFIRQAQRNSYSEYQRVNENLDININNIGISLEEIYKGEIKKIKYKRYKPCVNCDGKGYEDDDKDLKCNHCNGEKLTYDDEIVELDIIAYMRDQAKRFMSRGKGNFSKHYESKSGDLYLNLVPIPNDDYIIEYNNLHHIFYLDIKTSVLGGKIDYYHLDGKTYSVKIPPKTQNGDKLKLNSKGLILDNNTKSRGDLIIHIELKIDYDNMLENDLEKIKDINF